MIEWTDIDWGDNVPEENRQVVAMSPDGEAYVTHWRSAYNIFCCQSKTEDSHEWKWAYLDGE